MIIHKTIKQLLAPKVLLEYLWPMITNPIHPSVTKPLNHQNRPHNDPTQLPMNLDDLRWPKKIWLHSDSMSLSLSFCWSFFILYLLVLLTEKFYVSMTALQCSEDAHHLSCPERLKMGLYVSRIFANLQLHPYKCFMLASYWDDFICRNWMQNVRTEEIVVLPPPFLLQISSTLLLFCKTLLMSSADCWPLQYVPFKQDALSRDWFVESASNEP